MAINVFIFLILTVIAQAALKKALFPAQFVQNGKLACLELFRAGNAVIFNQAELIKNRKSKIKNLKRLLFFIRGVEFPIRTRLRIAVEWGKRCVARASTVKTGYFHALCRRIRACACDIFAAEISETVYCRQQIYCWRSMVISSLCSINAASRYYRVPIRSEERMCGEHRVLAGYIIHILKKIK